MQEITAIEITMLHVDSSYKCNAATVDDVYIATGPRTQRNIDNRYASKRSENIKIEIYRVPGDFEITSYICLHCGSGWKELG